jgi:hypothetical protein
MCKSLGRTLQKAGKKHHKWKANAFYVSVASVAYYVWISRRQMWVSHQAAHFSQCDLLLTISKFCLRSKTSWRALSLFVQSINHEHSQMLDDACWVLSNLLGINQLGDEKSTWLRIVLSHGNIFWNFFHRILKRFHRSFLWFTSYQISHIFLPCRWNYRNM